MDIHPDYQSLLAEVAADIPVSPTETHAQKKRGVFWYVMLFCIGLLVGIIVWIFIISLPPKHFKPGTMITVYSGMTIRELASVAQNNQLIRSSLWFRVIMSSRWKGKPIVTGDYLLEKPEHVFSIARRFVRGSYGNSRIKITFPEGITRYEMADILSQKIPEFRRDVFLQETVSQEGYLFPDTYYFFRTQSVDQIITKLQDQWNMVMRSFQDMFQTSENPKDATTIVSYGGKVRTAAEIITMASILEREANNAEEARVVAGILWKRMEKGLPLQVDATFKYTLGKTSSELTMNDLQKDSAYNTYTRTGLPAGPIGNPGKMMISAALNPVDSPYWYYLHDDQGTIHYAEMYQEHLKNKEKYLK